MKFKLYRFQGPEGEWYYCATQQTAQTEATTMANNYGYPVTVQSLTTVDIDSDALACLLANSDPRVFESLDHMVTVQPEPEEA